MIWAGAGERRMHVLRADLPMYLLSVLAFICRLPCVPVNNIHSFIHPSIHPSIDYLGPAPQLDHTKETVIVAQAK